MRKTVVSLYLIVFFALLGFGWALDQIYSNYQDAGDDPATSFIGVFDSMIHHLDHNFDKQASSTELSRTLPDLFQLDSFDSFPLPAELQTKMNAGELIILDSEMGISLHRRLQNHALILGMGPIPNTEKKPDDLEYVFTTVFYLGVAFVLIIWIAPLIRGVEKLSAATTAIGKGELGTRLQRKNFYLSQLFSDFNAMSERLETLSDNNQLFSQAVSHDLRTPLSRIEFALEKISSDITQRERAELITNIRNNIQQIDQLSTELLDYARIENTRVIKNSEVDLNIFIQQVIADYSELACDIVYDSNEAKKTVLLLDSQLFHKVLNNLIGNAVRFAESRVRIQLLSSEYEFKIIVEDDGQGISENHLNLIFKPFSQLRKKSNGHYGLGLAICARVMKLLDGKIQADNQSSIGGARFTVSLLNKKLPV